ncbi:MacB family efflux pump subunit [Labrys sp. ZIDIC5]|uniref:MacB family efflux pump subunit n=1 Tax=Labrys sedimenti TaxID=3106036 RepID=UPI002ACA3DBF|nr:MacB family efflux pump subunit [Labrys sp. ZIDIC5]MDZ5451258.1 MacB family efflux pump subunit [Labrys sp. ZIDIC5]
MASPLILLQGVHRAYPSGEGSVVALHDVDLSIAAGEMVAIVGTSGSGKSTLLNILGCLDRPSGGSYRVAGRDTGTLTADELAALRREYFGFIFQRYHLLAEMTAIGNVEMPAIYTGLPPSRRQVRAQALLHRLGMADRLDHRPTQLSGGQQQRVSIARALMNGAGVIFADEPTGALDSTSGAEVLRILDELHAGGQTIIIVTHDMAVARRAERIIELRDGAVVSDRSNRRGPQPEPSTPGTGVGGAARASTPAWRVRIDQFREAFRMALRSMNAHRLRTILTMLGIIIGVASVVGVVALGAGTQQKVLADINSLGTNTLEVFPGKDFGDVRSGKITTLVLTDAQALAGQPYVAAASPTVSTSKTLRLGSVEVTAQINGVGEDYFAVKGTKLAAGAFFDADSVRRIAQDVVIDDNTRKALFAGASTSPVGRIILVGQVPCRIVGLTRPQQGGFGSSANPSVYLPYTTVQARFLGTTSLRSISVRVVDEAPTDRAEQAVSSLLAARHNAKDFFILNTDDIRRTITSTTQVLTLLVAAIAGISLVVGGVGVTNIMLVSVSERIAEIGVRMAVGARRSDILQQFLIEAVLVCLIGGLTGIGLALGLGAVFNAVSTTFSLHYSLASIAIAFLSSMLIGVVFGYMPARNASRLDPATALARE